MAHWLETSVLPAAIAAGLLLLVLWPTKQGGTRLLRRWGVARPEPAQVTAAVRYLRQRRVLYVVLFLLFPSAAGAVVDTDTPSYLVILVPLLIAMLVAEAIATLRPVSGVRTASLDRRTWRDLVPRWAVRTLGAGAVLAVVLAVAGGAWLVLGYVVGCLLLVGGLVALAVRRPAVDDEIVDAALRTRTARVAVGIGFGWLATALPLASRRFQDRWFADQDQFWFEPGDEVRTIVHVAVIVAGFVCWRWVAVPSKQWPAISR
ncbi:hypothetical protein [Actinophytocola sediminis]